MVGSCAPYTYMTNSRRKKRRSTIVRILMDSNDNASVAARASWKKKDS